MDTFYEGEGGLRPRPVYEEVGYARSTWRRVKEFQKGLRSLSNQMPLIAARTYLALEVKDETIPEELYALVDELQALRMKGISSEMRYVGAQAFVRFKKFPEEAVYLVCEYGPDALDRQEAELAVERAIQQDKEHESNWSACAQLLLGDDVLEGKDIRFGFSNEVYAMVPSLKVYEYFMWFDLDELED